MIADDIKVLCDDEPTEGTAGREKILSKAHEGNVAICLSICNAGASRNPKTRFAKVTPTDDIKNQKIYEYRKIILDMS